MGSSSGSAAAPEGASTSGRPPSPEEQEDARFHEAYAKARANFEALIARVPQAYTISQLYNINRPPPVPLTEYEQRRRKRDAEDILAAARKAGAAQDAVREGLGQLDALLPNLVDLNRMRASDWVKLASDVQGVAGKLILLKTLYPKADAFSMVAARPKTLLQSDSALAADAEAVKRMLAGASDVDAIVQAVPELVDAAQLARSLAWLRASFPGQDAVALLQENPLILRNIGESNVEDSAEYGEMTTKD